MLDGFEGVVQSVDEIAAISVHTPIIVLKILALFCFVFIICLMVFEQLVRAMSKFASFLIRAKAILHISPA